MKRVVIYARVDSQDKSYQLDKQIKDLRAYCESNGYKIIREIKECCNSNTISKALLGITGDNQQIDMLVVCNKKVLCKRSKESNLFEKLLYELDIDLEYVEE